MKGNIVETSSGVVWVKHDWLCKRFMGLLPEDIFFANTNSEGYICIPKFKLEKLEADKTSYDHRSKLLDKITTLNNKSIQQEKNGDINGAIKTYENCITIGYPAFHSYDRLMILYRKTKDYTNEERVILKALSIFTDASSQKKYSDRLAKVRKLRAK